MSKLPATEVYERFLATSVGLRFLFGINIYSESIANAIPVAGFVESAPSRSSHLGFPVVALADLPAGATVVVCSGGRPKTAANIVRAYTPYIIDYFSFLRLSSLPLRDVRFNEHFAMIYQDRSADFKWLIDRLEDAESSEIAADLIAFRRTLEMEMLDSFEEAQHRQYFEPFLNLRANELFYDIGAFDGETTQQFIDHCPGFSGAVLFEPDPRNAQVCRERFSTASNVEIVEIALSDNDGTVHFEAEADSTSYVIPSGGIEVAARPIDALRNGLPKPTFVKVDVEGYEEHVVLGGVNLFSDNSVKVAISIYHSPRQLVDVPILLDSLRPASKFYLRHYTESIYETVLFVI